jgi:hypothetical protein
VRKRYRSHKYFRQEYGESEGRSKEDCFRGDGRGVEKYIKNKLI